MSVIREAKIVRITQPEPGVFHLGLQFEEPGITRGVLTFERIQINHEQLCGIAEDAVVMALGWMRRAE